MFERLLKKNPNEIKNMWSESRVALIFQKFNIFLLPSLELVYLFEKLRQVKLFSNRLIFRHPVRRELKILLKYQ